MSNIEPTEEQYEAAILHVVSMHQPIVESDLLRLSIPLAALLAEREAKLREEVLASYKGPIGHIRYMHDSDVMKLRARVAELEGLLNPSESPLSSPSRSAVSLLQRLAHYDDAKAAEGGDG